MLTRQRYRLLRVPRRDEHSAVVLHSPLTMAWATHRPCTVGRSPASRGEDIWRARYAILRKLRPLPKQPNTSLSLVRC